MRVFVAPDVRAVCDLYEGLLGEESLATELDELVEAGVLLRSESVAGSSEGELQFGRGLVRDVIYESLSSRQQRDSHAQIGRLLASRFFAGHFRPERRRNRQNRRIQSLGHRCRGRLQHFRRRESHSHR